MKPSLPSRFRIGTTGVRLSQKADIRAKDHSLAPRGLMITPHLGGKPLNLHVMVTPSVKENHRRKISHLGEGIEARPIAPRDQIPQIVVDPDGVGLGKPDGMTRGEMIGVDLIHRTHLGEEIRMSHLRHLHTMYIAKTAVGGTEIVRECGPVIPSVPLVSSLPTGLTVG